MYRLLIILLIFSCSGEGNADGGGVEPPPTKIIPSNLVVNIEINGADSDSPSGDGSGVVKFTATATDADSVVVNLGSSIEDVIAQRRSDEPLHTCSQCATLQFVFEFFADVKFRRLICLDVDRRPVGIISVRDLLSYFVD